MQVADSIFQSYIFNNAEDGTMKGGYQFSKSIKPSPKSLVGGGAESLGISRFENLVIPIGLVVNKYNNMQYLETFKVKETCEEDIPQDLFDKLFNQTTHIRTSKRKTRKSNA